MPRLERPNETQCSVATPSVLTEEVPQPDPKPNEILTKTQPSVARTLRRNGYGKGVFGLKGAYRK